MTRAQVAPLIAEHFSGAQVQGDSPFVVAIPVDQWVGFARFAKDTLRCRFFAFSTAIDWKDQGLEVVAKVDNVDDKLSLLLKTRLGPGVSACASLTGVYKGADWMERECYDMFGIRFEGHPDLRRILLGDDWKGHPLLKSYPVDAPYPPFR